MKAKNHKPQYQVTAGLIWKEGRVLITRRPKGAHLAGFWEFPGGKQESGETLRECLEREIREELGISIKVGEHLMTVEHEYETKVITLHAFHCRNLKGRPAALEGQEFRWVYPRKLPGLTFPPPDRVIIEALDTRENPHEFRTAEKEKMRDKEP